MIERYTSPQMAELWSLSSKYQTWLHIELTVCEVLSEQGIIPNNEWEEIRLRASFDTAAIEQAEARTNHDVAAFVEVVERTVGSAGRWIHYGLTSSDLVDTGLALLMTRAISLLRAALNETKAILEEKIQTSYRQPVIGRTHGQHAEPITFGLKLATMYDELRRSDKRLARVSEECCLGKLSGAVGTYSHLTMEVEEAVFSKLGVEHALASSQIVPRDMHAEILNAVALLGGVLERWSMEIRNLLRPEIGELTMNPRHQAVGSSSMPHKSNPIEFEKICGLARVLRSYSAVALETIALWHERDLTNSSVERITIPGAFCLIEHMVKVFNAAFKSLGIDSEMAARNLGTFPSAHSSQTLLLRLVEKGMSRSTAHTLIKGATRQARANGLSLAEVLCSEKAVEPYLSCADIEACTKTVDLQDVTLKVLARIGVRPPPSYQST